MTSLMDGPAGGPGKKSQGTTIIGGGSTGTRLVGAQTADKATTNDPVVGWLVVIRGPGRGQSVNLGYGMNIVGRGYQNRVSLDFGDEQISQEDHFRIAYDREKRDFHLIPATGMNLLYVEKSAVYVPLPLINGTDIEVGATTLRFIALCGKDWDWSETEQADSQVSGDQPARG